MSSASKSSIGDTPEPATSVDQSGSAASSASAPARCGERRSLSMRRSTTRCASSGANGDRSVVSGGGSGLGGAGFGALVARALGRGFGLSLRLRIAAPLDGAGALDGAMRRPHLDRNRRRQPRQMRAEEQERQQRGVPRRRDHQRCDQRRARPHSIGLHPVAPRRPLGAAGNRYSDRVRPAGREIREFRAQACESPSTTTRHARCFAPVSPFAKRTRGRTHGRQQQQRKEAAHRVPDHREAGPREGGVDAAGRRLRESGSVDQHLPRRDPVRAQAPDSRGGACGRASRRTSRAARPRPSRRSTSAGASSEPRARCRPCCWRCRSPARAPSRWRATPSARAAAPSAAPKSRGRRGQPQRRDRGASSRCCPGIGPGKARAIAEHRHAHPFRRIDELTKVKGIGRKTFGHLRPYLTTVGPTTLDHDVKLRPLATLGSPVRAGLGSGSSAARFSVTRRGAVRSR